MEKQDHDIDKIFQENLGETREFDVPQNFVDDMNVKLNASKKDERSKKRAVIWLSAILILLCSTAYLTGWFSPEQKSSESTIVNNEEQKNTQTNSNTEESQQSNSNNNSATTAVNLDESTTLNENQNPELKQSIQLSSNDEIQLVDQSKKVREQKVNDQSYKKLIQNQNDLAEDERKQVSVNQKDDKLLTQSSEKDQKDQIDQKDDVVAKEDEAQKNLQDEKDHANQKDQQAVDKEKSDQLDENQKLAIDDKQDDKIEQDKLDAQDNEKIEKTSTIEESDLLTEKADTATTVADASLKEDVKEDVKTESDTALVQNELLDSTASDQLNNKEELAPENEIIKSETNRKIQFNIQTYGGLDVIQTKMIAANPELASSFDENKLRRLSGLYGAEFGIEINNFYAGLGLQLYSNKDGANYDSFQFNTTFVDSIQTISTDSIFLDTNTSLMDTITTITFDTIQVASIDTAVTNSQVLNQYKIIAIPLTFGYTFTLNTWQFRPQLSAIFELTRQISTGSYPLFDGSPNLQQISAIKFGMSLGIQLQVQKHFGKFYGYLSPGYRLKLTNSAFQNGIAVKHNAFQLMFGVGYRF